VRKYTYDRWSGGKRTVEATEVRFEPSGHVSFWVDSVLILAERTEQVNNLTEVAEWTECPNCGQDVFYDPEFGWRGGTGNYSCGDNLWGTHGEHIMRKRAEEEASG
jgi:hypothetical protein